MNRKKIIIAGLIVVIVCLVGWFAYDINFLRITSTTPTSSRIPTNTPYIIFNFNDQVSSVTKVTIDGAETSYKINERSITVNRYDDLFEAKSKHTIVFHGLVASNKKSVGDTSFNFTAKYIPQDSQPDDIQQALIERSNSGQVNDAFFLLPSPIGTTEDLPFYISTFSGQRVDEPYVQVTILAEVRDFDTGTQNQVSNQRAEEIYTQAIQYIKDRGGKPEEYDIRFSNNYLNQKYGKNSLN